MIKYYAIPTFTKVKCLDTLELQKYPKLLGLLGRAARLTTTNNHSAARVRQDAEALVRTRSEARLEEWLGAPLRWLGIKNNPTLGGVIFKER